MASITERTDKDGRVISYRAQIRVAGEDHVSATFLDKKAAKRWARSTEAAIRDGRYQKTSEARKRTFAELIDWYIDKILPKKKQHMLDHQKTQLKWFKEQLGTRKVADVTTGLIKECCERLSERGASGRPIKPSTIGHYLAALSHVFTEAIEKSWAEENPVTAILKKNKYSSEGRLRFLSDDEKDRLLEACKRSSNPFLYPCVVLALSTGMRKSELMNLTWADVDLEKCSITLNKTKNGESRKAPLAGHALDLLKEHAKNKTSTKDLLFPATPRSNKPIKPINLRPDFLKALKEAQIEGFRWHDLRHSAASYLAMNKATLLDIAIILGHKSLDMARRYSHVNDDHISSVVASMNEKIFASSHKI